MKNINIRLERVLLLGFLLMILTPILNNRYRSEASPTILGVSPQDVDYYKGLLSSSSATIKCKDGSKMFSKSQLNDDFCDCPDGSDEPGTSACPNGKFHCKNAGHTPLVLYSSRVNDGICDCCDGSDEYDGIIKCPNTCWEAGKAAREKLKKKIATYKEGVTIRKREIEQAKISIAKDEAELSKLKDSEKALKTLVEQLKERKEEVEKAEEQERLLKEKEEKERIETEASKETEVKAHHIEPTQSDIHDKVGPVSAEDTQGISELELSDHPVEEEISNGGAEEVKEDSSDDREQEGEDTVTDEDAGIDTDNQDENVAEDTESLSKEELGRLVASRWTGEKTEHHTEESDASVPEDVQNPDEIADESNDDEDNSYDSEDEHKYDDEESEEQVQDFGEENHYDSHKADSDDELEFSDTTGSSSSSWLDKIQQTARSIFTAVNIFKKPVNISDAAQVRKEYDESSDKLSKMQSRISSLKQKLKQDFGPEKEFYSFYGQCFELKQNKYVYKVCPFKQATQEEGYSTTRLGSWEKFEDSYRVMEFLNGDKCWNGPDRSLKVKLRCGLKNELSDVDEPSRCEYVALLSTPALCLDSKLKELQDKLESMNKDQPQGHDEL